MAFFPLFAFPTPYDSIINVRRELDGKDKQEKESAARERPQKERCRALTTRLLHVCDTISSENGIKQPVNSFSARSLPTLVLLPIFVFHFF